MCEEYETFHDRTGQPVVGRQSSSSFVPSVIKTEVLVDCDDLASKDLLLQQYGARFEKLSQQDKLSKFLYGCRTKHFVAQSTVALASTGSMPKSMCEKAPSYSTVGGWIKKSATAGFKHLLSSCRRQR